MSLINSGLLITHIKIGCVPRSRSALGGVEPREAMCSCTGIVRSLRAVGQEQQYDPPEHGHRSSVDPPQLCEAHHFFAKKGASSHSHRVVSRVVGDAP